DRAGECRKRNDGAGKQWMAPQQRSAPAHQQRIQREEDHVLVKKHRRVPAVADGGNLVIEVGVPARLEIHELIRRRTTTCLGGGCGHRSDDRYGDGAEEENRQPRADQADKYGGPEHRAPAGDRGAREASREQATLVAQPDGPRRARVTYASVTTVGRGIGAVRQENTRQPTNSRISVHTMRL